jgi:hypothetical protein
MRISSLSARFARRAAGQRIVVVVRETGLRHGPRPTAPVTGLAPDPRSAYDRRHESNRKIRRCPRIVDSLLGLPFRSGCRIGLGLCPHDSHTHRTPRRLERAVSGGERGPAASPGRRRCPRGLGQLNIRGRDTHGPGHPHPFDPDDQGRLPEVGRRPRHRLRGAPRTAHRAAHHPMAHRTPGPAVRALRIGLR